MSLFQEMDMDQLPKLFAAATDCLCPAAASFGIRNPNLNASGGAFDERTIEAVWKKGTPEAHVPLFRKDVCGASMKRDLYGKLIEWGWEIDHIKPVAKGGTDEIENLLPLQWENNRHKGDDWPNWICKVRI
jgi:hypothetical protein